VLRLPGGFTDEESFRSWRATQPVLEGGRVSWREGGLWIETEGLDPGPVLPLKTLGQWEQREGVSIVIDGWLRIPAGVVDLESFQSWMWSEAYPDGVRFSWLAGLLWIER
jgi:hypothetical protein